MAEQFVTDLSKLSKSTQEVLAANGQGFSNNEKLTAEEYLIRRGGVNPVTGQYGDSYNVNTDLTDAEYLAALQGTTGTGQGSALNVARAKKAYDYALSIAKTDEEKTAARIEYESLLSGNAAANPNDATAPSGTSTSTTSTTSTSTLKTEAQIAAETAAAVAKGQRQSAYDLLYEEFDKYGLGSLVTPLKDLITSGVSSSEFTIRLRETDAYKKRFAANEARVKNGLRALSESEYIRNEDNYQEVMRRRGLPPEYYAKGDLGVQKGFDALLAGDVSATELEDRIVTAQDRVLNANPEVAQALKAFYPGISNGDILAYSLDPVNAINAIKRKITAAEIGGEATRAGLTTNVSDATYLEKYGVTKDQAETGYGKIAGGLQRGSQLASIYGEDPYTQTTAEQEVFNVPGQVEARKQRQKITGLEQATFSGRTGVSSSALARDRAGGY